MNAHARSTAFLRCFNQPVPETWELQTELEANQAAGEVDYAVEEQLEELGFEVEEKSFAEELTEMAKFDAVSTDDLCATVRTPFSRFHTSKRTRANATRVATAVRLPDRLFQSTLPNPKDSYPMLNIRASACRNRRKMTAYALSPVPQVLQQQLDAFMLHRTSVFAARRTGGAVVSSSADGDKQASAHTHTTRSDVARVRRSYSIHRTSRLHHVSTSVPTRRCSASSDTLTSSDEFQRGPLSSCPSSVAPISATWCRSTPSGCRPRKSYASAASQTT